ncbi:ABC transporter ATP-binding protein [Aquipuribacter hungaricus]|uniref:ABC transporter ATP-binding protein n=1 Tax=Aquipuribacter hungaricus TaxID=545624 RepID=A0ABV7WF19_9MICO
MSDGPDRTDGIDGTGGLDGSDGLDARLRLRRDGWDLDLDLVVPPGRTLALLGPNGAGKSTALRLLAGLLRLPEGHVRLGSRTWDDPAAGVHLPPAARGVGLVPQDSLLFPHLDARDNVAFGPRARGVPAAEARQRATAWLDRVGLAGLGHRRPGELSGGQAQRVALARALVTAPGLLLLDEPLAALDAATRSSVRTDLAHHLAAFDGACVLVTHDPLDAMVLADDVVVLEDGRAVQQGTPSQVARSPRTDYVARLVGLNLLRGTATGQDVALAEGGVLRAAAGEAGGPVPQGEVLVAFAPAAVAMSPDRPGPASPRNVWGCTVAATERHGETVRVRLDGAPPVLVDVTAAAVAELGLRPGAPVWASLKATEVTVYPA